MSFDNVSNNERQVHIFLSHRHDIVIFTFFIEYYMKMHSLHLNFICHEERVRICGIGWLLHKSLKKVIR